MIDRTEQRHIPTTLVSKSEQLELLDDLRGYLGRDLSKVEECLRGAVKTSGEFSGLAEQAAAMGGKRLRPMLVLLCAYASSSKMSPAQHDDLISIAASVELVHAASLVHDDVLDNATLRRHRPTILAQSDNRTAILLGDFLFTRAYGLAARCRSTLPARQIAASAAALCTGELRQGLAAGNWQIGLAHYRQMLVQKTGSLCGVSCRLGSWRVGAAPATQRSMKRFGVLLGLAFQVFDDWLDYWGSDAVGKTLGTDLNQGKATLPILHVLESHPDYRLRLLNTLQAGTRERFSEVLQILDTCDASEYTLRTAANLSSRAADTLSILPGNTATRFLTALAQFSANRSA